MKVKINGYIVAQICSWAEEPDFTWLSYDPTKYSSEHLVLSRHEIEFEVPDDFNLQAAKIAILENEAEKTRAEFHKRINEINDHISKLQALEAK